MEQRGWILWASLGVVGLLCAVLAVLQYQWIGDVSLAERARMRDDLQGQLAGLNRTFNQEVDEALRSAGSGYSDLFVRVERRAGPPEPDHAARLVIHRRDEDGWVEAELNPDTLRRKTFPALFAVPALADYDIQVVSGGQERALYYSSGPTRIFEHPDGLASLGDFGPGRGFGPGGPSRPGPPPGPPPGARGNGNGGMLIVLARHRNGTLESLVAATQRRNLAVSSVILILILATAAMLLRVTRKAWELADAHVGFAAGVSHELRTPLTVIRTAAFNLSSGKLAARPEQIEKYGKLISGEAERLEVLIDQVLRFASGRAGKVIEEPRPVDVASVVRELVDAMPDAAVDLQIEPDTPEALADERALRHAVRNLIDNAVRYGKEGVVVRVKAKLCHRMPHVEVEVSDAGPGIPADETQRIFEPFFRGSRAVREQIHGSGLGLHIVKTIAEAHQGSVAVESEPGRGTHFFLRIPAHVNLTI